MPALDTNWATSSRAAGDTKGPSEPGNFNHSPDKLIKFNATMYCELKFFPSFFFPFFVNSNCKWNGTFFLLIFCYYYYYYYYYFYFIFLKGPFKAGARPNIFIKTKFQIYTQIKESYTDRLQGVKCNVRMGSK